MKAITLPLVLVVVCCSAATMANAQTTDQPDWQAVMQLPVAANVRIQTKDKHKKTGWLVAVTDTEAKLEDDGEIFTFTRDAIKKLWQLREPNRKKQRIFRTIGGSIGMMAGITLGVAIGLQECYGDCGAQGVGMLATMVGLPVAGAVIGHKLAGDGKPVLVYVAP